MKCALRRFFLIYIVSCSMSCFPSTLTLEEVKVQLKDADIQYYYLSVEKDGTIHLDLSGCDIPNLTTLSTFPISTLKLSNTKVIDLSPLAGMKIKALFIDRTGVVDLTPIKGLPLENINLSRCQAITSIAPLKEIPLKYLNVADTGIQDLSPIEGMPLKSLTFSSENITNGLSIVRAMTTLEYLGNDGVDEKGGNVMYSYPTKLFWRLYDEGNLKGKNNSQPAH